MHVSYACVLFTSPPTCVVSLRLAICRPQTSGFLSAARPHTTHLDSSVHEKPSLHFHNLIMTDSIFTCTPTTIFFFSGIMILLLWLLLLTACTRNLLMHEDANARFRCIAFLAEKHSIQIYRRAGGLPFHTIYIKRRVYKPTPTCMVYLTMVLLMHDIELNPGPVPDTCDHTYCQEDGRFTHIDHTYGPSKYKK